MTIWNKEAQTVELDPVETAFQFWESRFGQVAGERCYPLDTMLSRYLASEHGAVVWNDHGFETLKCTALACWPKEWR